MSLHMIMMQEQQHRVSVDEDPNLVDTGLAGGKDNPDLYEIIHEQNILLKDKDEHIAQLQQTIKDLNAYIEQELRAVQKAAGIKQQKHRRRKSRRRLVESEEDVASNAPSRQEGDAATSRSAARHADPGEDGDLRPTLHHKNVNTAMQKEPSKRDIRRSSRRDDTRRSRSTKRLSSTTAINKNLNASLTESDLTRTEDEGTKLSSLLYAESAPQLETTIDSLPAGRQRSSSRRKSERRHGRRRSSSTSKLTSGNVRAAVHNASVDIINGDQEMMHDVSSGRISGRFSPNDGDDAGRNKKRKSKSKKKTRKSATNPYRQAPPRQISKELIPASGQEVVSEIAASRAMVEAELEPNVLLLSSAAQQLDVDENPEPYLLSTDDAPAADNELSSLSHHLMSLKMPRRPDEDSDEDTHTSQPFMRKSRANSPVSFASGVGLDRVDGDEPKATLKAPSVFHPIRPSSSSCSSSSMMTPPSMESRPTLSSNGLSKLNDGSHSGSSVSPPSVEGHPVIKASIQQEEEDHVHETYQVSQYQIIDPYNDVGLYTGSLSQGTNLPQGVGRMVYHEEDHERSYDGEWVDGRWHGHGKLINSNGDVYTGHFAFDERDGQGTYVWASGRTYVGNFFQDKRHGKGELVFPDGSKYIGEFFNGARDGQGRCEFAEGGHYEGEWKGNKFCGFGECVWPDGRIYKGDFLDNEANGYGVEYNPDGTVRHEGLWDHDEPI